jgi:hypothetical protein
MPRWVLTVRSGPRVERARFESLQAALEGLEERLDELAPNARRQTIKALGREYEATRLVAVRGEIAGPSRLLPSVRGGVDLRGDGSTEAYTGRWRRARVERRAGETAYDALRRVLAAQPGAA